MPHADGVKAVQTGLCDDNRPVGVSAARLPENTQHRMLNRIRHLHRDQQEVRLPLTPGNVLRGVVARLSKSPRIEKSPVRAATIAVLPAPVLPRSHTTGAIVCARLRASSGSAANPGMSPNSTSLMAFRPVEKSHDFSFLS